MLSRRHAALVLLAGAAACGGKPDAPAPPPPPAAAAFDHCTLLTADEIQAALGWRPTEVTPISANNAGHCKYQANPTAVPAPQTVRAGIGVCPTNMPCTELPDFATSAELAAYRKKGYEGGGMAGLDPVIEAIEGMGVPAIRHELAGLQAIEMVIGGKRLAYVETWGSAEVAKALAEKVLARAKQ